MLGRVMVLHTESTVGLARPWVRWVAILLICGAYLQGSIDKLYDFAGARAEMLHFGLSPTGPFAALTIVFELAACAMVLTGRLRWLGAFGLAGFTAIASFIANRFWEVAPPQRLMLANAFFEHWGLVGAFVLIAWHDLAARDER